MTGSLALNSQAFDPDNTPIASRNFVFRCIALIAIAVVLASIHPMEWSSYLLHQLGTLLFLGMMLWLWRPYQLSRGTWLGATAFLLLHILGARYLYSYVPYGEWTRMAFGTDLNELFGWQRNIYDRLVHFSYGLLLYPLMYRLVRHHLTVNFASDISPNHHSTDPTNAKPFIAHTTLIVITLMLNLSSSVLYEFVEWGLALTMSPENAEAYNGQQGDMWDAHSDIALALLGGIVAVGVNSLFSKSRSAT